MQFKFLIGVLIIALLTVACEKIINVPLKDADRRIVVEMQIENMASDSNNFLLLSKTGSVYDGGFEKISGATVTLMDESGASWVFSESAVEPGRYSHPTFSALANTGYSLTVDIDGTVLTSSSHTFDIPAIDSIYYDVLPNLYSGFTGNMADSVIEMFFSFDDNGAQTNYYRSNITINGELQDTYYIFDDKLFNGGNFVATLYATEIYPGDTVLIELVSMDDANYNFLATMANNNSGVAPANPESNIVGDAIGYFGAFTVDTMSIIVPE